MIEIAQQLSDTNTLRGREVRAATFADESWEALLWSANDLTTLSAILGRKWTASIVVALRSEPLRHGDLCRRLSGIARKVLHQSLNGLIRDGLVEKIVGVDDCGGASVTYGLTPLGESLTPVFDAIQMWCCTHLTEIAQARLDGGAVIRVAAVGTVDMVTSG